MFILLSQFWSQTHQERKQVRTPANVPIRHRLMSILITSFHFIIHLKKNNEIVESENQKHTSHRVQKREKRTIEDEHTKYIINGSLLQSITLVSKKKKRERNNLRIMESSILSVKFFYVSLQHLLLGCDISLHLKRLFLPLPIRSRFSFSIASNSLSSFTVIDRLY